MDVRIFGSRISRLLYLQNAEAFHQHHYIYFEVITLVVSALFLHTDLTTLSVWQTNKFKVVINAPCMVFLLSGYLIDMELEVEVTIFSTPPLG
jgi:hypothetical protein